MTLKNKRARWYYVDHRDSTQAPTESDPFEHVIVTSMQSALEPDFYKDALLAEYEDLMAAIDRGCKDQRVRRMLSRCVRALKSLNG